MKICIIRTNNETVTTHNFDIFVKSFKECGFDVYETLFRKEMFSQKFDFYLASDLITASKLCSRRKKFFYWMQGIAPEESIIDGKSKMQYHIWSFLEKMVSKKCIYLWTVSNEMVRHIESKYHISIKEKSSTIPCYNALLKKESFFQKNKYKNNIFTYAGGLTSWQCFDEIIDIYKSIENKHQNTSLLLLVRDKAKAEQIVKEKEIKKYIIDYVPADELDKRIAVAKFGFIIRKDNPVNNVATPTKISSYISNGVIPIYTSSIKDFTNLFQNKRYAIQYDDNSFSAKLNEMMNEEIDPKDIYDEYFAFFEEYYNDRKYIDKAKIIINRIIKTTN